MKNEKELAIVRKELEDIQEKYDNILQQQNDLQNSQAIFLRNLSQNIRIPMNGVMGMLEVLRMTNLNDEQEDYVSLISNYNNNLLSIINDILDYSNLMNNSLQLESDYFEIENLVEEITELLHYKIEGKGLKLVLKIDKQIPDYLYGDQHRIKQILINLLNNAIQHTREGEIILTIEQLKQENQKSVLKFSVKDTGFGIENSLIRTLKKELNSNELTTKISLNGVGLGLAIAQSLLKLMDAQLSIETELDKGSDFWFTLAIPTRHKNRSGIFNENNPGQRTLKILLVEDNMLNQKFAKVTLSKQGHYLDIAENGKIAIEKFKLDTYDLILMDIQLPIMSGIEATKEIRKMEKEKNIDPIKIIAVTAFALDNKREECMAAGMDNFLAKPFKPTQLIKMIDEIKFS
ncbi:MAG: response regulator [Bacteroidales bacterium]|jgi:CheY-like chemotaxis protein|nr:response regulator [Bacteroidales bacterium]